MRDGGRPAGPRRGGAADGRRADRTRAAPRLRGVPAPGVHGRLPADHTPVPPRDGAGVRRSRRLKSGRYWRAKDRRGRLPMEQDLATQRYERSHDPRRLIALSDGVFAIVLTLMVLEIHVPELTDVSQLRGALDQIWPSFVAFVISFAIVGISWMAHRDLFAMLRLTDRNLVWLNTVYLLPSMVPFGAAL